MNRGSAWVIDEHETLLPASMRPRFMNRGSPAVRFYDTEPDSCFNEAPIHESGK